MFLLVLTILESFLAGLDTQVLRSDLTIQVTEQKASAPMSYSGSVTMLGEQFLLSAFGAEAAYDGRTMTVYNADLDEMTITTPTEEELTDSNPLLFARALRKACNTTERAGKNGQQTVITMTPRNQTAGIVRLVLTVETESLLPRSIEVVEKQRTTYIRLLNATYSNDKPTFRIIPPEGAFVNDLR